MTRLIIVAVAVAACLAPAFAAEGEYAEAVADQACANGMGDMKKQNTKGMNPDKCKSLCDDAEGCSGILYKVKGSDCRVITASANCTDFVEGIYSYYARTGDAPTPPPTQAPTPPPSFPKGHYEMLNASVTCAGINAMKPSGAKTLEACQAQCDTAGNLCKYVLFKAAGKNSICKHVLTTTENCDTFTKKSKQFALYQRDSDYTEKPTGNPTKAPTATPSAAPSATPTSTPTATPTPPPSFPKGYYAKLDDSVTCPGIGKMKGSGAKTLADCEAQCDAIGDLCKFVLFKAAGKKSICKHVTTTTENCDTFTEQSKQFARYQREADATLEPTGNPTKSPTAAPSAAPSATPTSTPTANPTAPPSFATGEYTQLNASVTCAGIGKMPGSGAKSLAACNAQCDARGELCKYVLFKGPDGKKAVCKHVFVDTENCDTFTAKSKQFGLYQRTGNAPTAAPTTAEPTAAPTGAPTDPPTYGPGVFELRNASVTCAGIAKVPKLSKSNTLAKCEASCTMPSTCAFMLYRAKDKTCKIVAPDSAACGVLDLTAKAGQFGYYVRTGDQTPPPTEAPETTKPATEPATTKPATDPATDPATTKPATDPATDPATTKPATDPATDPATTKPATDPATDPATTKPATDPATDPATTKPATEPATDPATEPGTPDPAKTTKPSNPDTPAPTKKKDDDDGLTGGQIAGISIGVVAGVALIGIGSIFLMRRNELPAASAQELADKETELSVSAASTGPLAHGPQV